MQIVSVYGIFPKNLNVINKKIEAKFAFNLKISIYNHCTLLKTTGNFSHRYGHAHYNPLFLQFLSVVHFSYFLLIFFHAYPAVNGE